MYRQLLGPRQAGRYEVSLWSSVTTTPRSRRSGHEVSRTSTFSTPRPASQARVWRRRLWPSRSFDRQWAGRSRSAQPQTVPHDQSHASAAGRSASAGAPISGVGHCRSPSVTGTAGRPPPQSDRQSLWVEGRAVPQHSLAGAISIGGGGVGSVGRWVDLEPGLRGGHADPCADGGVEAVGERLVGRFAFELPVLAVPRPPVRLSEEAGARVLLLGTWCSGPELRGEVG
jgi:hypothetical protein